MSYEEKGTWVYLAVTLAVYAGYLVAVLAQVQTPLADTAYQVPLLVAIGIAVLATVVLRVIVEILNPSESHQVDTRDRDIDRTGTIRTWWLVIFGALVALSMALAEWPHFWIANAIYLGFVLQAAASSVVKIVAYRRGL